MKFWLFSITEQVDRNCVQAFLCSGRMTNSLQVKLKMAIFVDFLLFCGIPSLAMGKTRAGSVSVFGVGIGIRYFRRYFFMSVRYSVLVF